MGNRIEKLDFQKIDNSLKEGKSIEEISDLGEFDEVLA